MKGGGDGELRREVSGWSDCDKEVRQERGMGSEDILDW